MIIWFVIGGFVFALITLLINSGLSGKALQSLESGKKE
jgi:hypothetical protein